MATTQGTTATADTVTDGYNNTTADSVVTVATKRDQTAIEETVDVTVIASVVCATVTVIAICITLAVFFVYKLR